MTDPGFSLFRPNRRWALCLTTALAAVSLDASANTPSQYYADCVRGAWPTIDDAEKRAAFRIARAALAKSGTVTLEVALAGIPMIAAYKVSPIDAFIVRRLVRVPSYILANLVLGENVVPEIVQEECTPERLADALVPLFANTPERRSQVDAFARIDAIMEIGSRTPAARAADVVLSTLRRS